jgi:hypothetical protein
MESIHTLGRVSHQPSGALAAPKGSLWDKKEQLLGVIGYVVACVFALSVAPTAFAMGAAGCVVSLTVVPAVSNFIIQHRLLSKRNYLAYILTDVLTGATLLGSVYTVAHTTFLPARVAAGSAFWCTLAGFYLPLSLYKEFKAL